MLGSILTPEPNIVSHLASSYITFYGAVWLGLLILAFLLRNDESVDRPPKRPPADPCRQPLARTLITVRVESESGQQVQIGAGEQTLHVADIDVPVTIHLKERRDGFPGITEISISDQRIRHS